MGYFKESTTGRISLPSNSDYWVDIKTRFSYGEAKKFATANKEGSVDLEATADVFLREAITAWNLDDNNGNVLPITDENIALLDANDAFFIIEKAGGSVEAKKEVAGSSQKASGATSTETI